MNCWATGFAPLTTAFKRFWIDTLVAMAPGRSLGPTGLFRECWSGFAPDPFEIRRIPRNDRDRCDVRNGIWVAFDDVRDDVVDER